MRLETVIGHGKVSPVKERGKVLVSSSDRTSTGRRSRFDMNKTLGLCISHPTCLPLTALGQRMNPVIVDPHVHVWLNDPAFPWPAENTNPPEEDRTAEMLLQLMDEHGIDTV
jgi:hypothetical protein